MNIKNALLSNGWHSAIVNGAIKWQGKEDTIILYFKKHDFDLFMVMGKAKSNSWKAIMSFEQLKLLSANVNGFVKIAKRNEIKEIDNDFKNANELEHEITPEEEILLASIKNAISSNDFVSKEEIVKIFTDYFNQQDCSTEDRKIKAKNKAIDMVLNGLIKFDENGNWYINE